MMIGTTDRQQKRKECEKHLKFKSRHVDSHHGTSKEESIETAQIDAREYANNTTTRTHLQFGLSSSPRPSLFIFSVPDHVVVMSDSKGKRPKEKQTNVLDVCRDVLLTYSLRHDARC